ncbi:acyltransferase family protein [Vibrio sp. JC009]|uniref:acyltransferase n=1 Tax=Vibrio sp. JC009 TaxID=2912314 RepID=UPI0023AFED58|nr:acyltransferase family protein [Vibrio sp. JC009]WED21756.1 acyltransferase family protein [Vibrio sp. JC009]
MSKRVFFFDTLRCVAAVTVIAIHALGPYRHLFGDIPFSEWASAVTVNSISRWAVPVFIMITGALMLSDKRPFDLRYYMKRRLAKVLIPFVVWSLFYAYLSGWSAQGYNGEQSVQVLAEGYQHATYYHLGFFYYFIPLYFLIPFFQYMVRNEREKEINLYLGIWLISSALFLYGVDGPWSNQYWLYSGYLLLGYLLYQRLALSKAVTLLFFLAGCLGLASTVWMVITQSLESGEYTVGRWLSYKTLNTIAVASMIFVLGRACGEQVSLGSGKVIRFISRHSLGIYILHPVFLWPMIELKWYEGNHPLLMIPLWVVLSGSGALTISWLLSRSRYTNWLVP